VCHPNLESFVWRRHVGDHPNGHQHGGWKPKETSQLKNNAVLLFPMQELFRFQIPRKKARNKSLFNQQHPLQITKTQKLADKYLSRGT